MAPTPGFIVTAQSRTVTVTATVNSVNEYIPDCTKFSSSASAVRWIVRCSSVRLAEAVSRLKSWKVPEAFERRQPALFAPAGGCGSVVW
jgi:hypothetical protein